MTDKEILELAAKAAGITGWQSKHGYWNMTDVTGDIVVCCNAWGKFNSETGEAQNPTFADAVEELAWHPLTDDGDALRLAVKLADRITIRQINYQNKIEVRIRSKTWKTVEVFCNQYTDKYEATRRAIVRAAAEIGKAM